MPSTRSRCLRLSLALGITVSAASLLLGLGGGAVALLDFAPFLALLCLTLVWPEASARLLEKVIALGDRRRKRPTRHRARRRVLRSERDAGRIFVALAGARGPPRGLRPAHS
jgi:hypothetical protein